MSEHLVHLLLPRQHGDGQYDKYGLLGFAVCGGAVTKDHAELGSADSSQVTCEVCLNTAALQVRKALGYTGPAHYTMSLSTFTRTGVCGVECTHENPGTVTHDPVAVTCEVCRAIIAAG